MTHETAVASHGLLRRPDRPALAWRHIVGTAGSGSGAAPTIVFLPGYASDMAGSKATALFDWAQRTGRACLLFDYAGCGESEGDFADQTLEHWRDDALAIIGARVDGPLLLVGSSMGGWLMLLVAAALGADRMAGLVGIAAAPDFTDWGYSDDDKATLARDGYLLQPSPYGPEPTLTTLALWQSGERHRLLGGSTPLSCPVRLLHGMADQDVPYSVSLTLAERLESADVRVQLIKQGDHRLSREEDITLLIATVAGLLPDPNSANIPLS